MAVTTDTSAPSTTGAERAFFLLRTDFTIAPIAFWLDKYSEDQTEWGAPPPELVIAHTNLYWGYHRAPGRTAGTVETKDVDFDAPP